MITWLVQGAFGAALIALVALAADRFLRVRPATSHLLWLLVLVRLLAPPLPSFGEGTAPATAPAVSASGPSLALDVMGWMTRTFGDQWSNDLRDVVLAAWWIGLLAILAHQALLLLGVSRRLRAARRPPQGVLQRAAAVARQLGVGLPAVRMLGSTPGPFLWSLTRPTLVLPERQGSVSPMVLAHELSHLRRRDHWIGWLELFTLALHWWNPVFWLARRRLRLAAELACDACVVHHYPDRRRAYAGDLLQTVERAADFAPTPHAVPAIGSDARDFERRLAGILRGRSTSGVSLSGVALAALLLVLSLPGAAVPSLDGLRAAAPSLPTGISRTTCRRILAEADAILLEDPADGREHNRRGLALMGLGRYDEAALAFERMARLGHEPYKAAYNLACAQALCGRASAALDALERASEGDFVTAAILQQDPDLASLRDESRFEVLVERLRAAAPAPQ